MLHMLKKLTIIFAVIMVSNASVGQNIDDYFSDSDYFSESESALSVSGELIVQVRQFIDPALRDSQSRTNASVSFEPEFYYEAAESNDRFTFKPFMRWDDSDDERTHADIRELNWHHVADTWEIKTGVSSVFWGVTETVHLVNVINQIDGVENLDEEDLLGQPMINLTLVKNWGNLDVFILPGFRERTFASRDGRPGSNSLISVDQAIYQSSAKQHRTDLALRWSRSVDIWDIGVAYFHGTSREPRFSDQITYGKTPTQVNAYGEVELIPIYDVIDQLSVDLQATYDAWLFKLEAITRSGQDERFSAAAAGFEYTLFDLAMSGIDVGIVSEYLYDERDTKATDDDLSLAVRLAFNDVYSTELLAGVARDLNNKSQYFFVEANRRIGDSFKLALEVRGVSNVDKADPLMVLSGDNFAQLELGYYF